jgi:hypothetical protein
MDYLPLPLSLSDSETKFFVRWRASAARPNTIDPHPPLLGQFFLAISWPLKNQRKRALVHHLRLHHTRARGAGRVVSAVTRLPISF